MNIIQAARDGVLPESSFGIEEIRSARDKHGSGALHWAAGEGHLGTVIYLCQVVGLDVNEKAGGPTTLGRRPLHFAARNGRLDVVDYLVGVCGVDPDVEAKFGVTPLQLAAYMHHPKVCESLVEAGADPQAKNEFGCTLSHWFAMGPDNLNGSKFCTELDALNDRGHTPLHKAAFAGSRAVCEWLVHRGAPRHRRDNAGKTPADEAHFNGHRALANWLADDESADSANEDRRDYRLLVPLALQLFLRNDSSPLSVLGAKILVCLFQHGGNYNVEIPNLPRKFRRLWNEDLDIADRSSLGLPRGGGLLRVLNHPTFLDLFHIDRHPTPTVTLRPGVVDTLSSKIRAPGAAGERTSSAAIAA